MKSNRIKPNKSKLALSITAGIVVLCAIIGIKVTYSQLRAIYTEKCIITDASVQIQITSGRMVPASTIAEELGLNKGNNTADMDFCKKRESVLKRIPNLKDIQITRILPDKIIVNAEERKPIARINTKGGRPGRVVDEEGVVFICQRGTQALPLIREAMPPGTQKGNRIDGRVRAALDLVEVCREPENLELNVLEIDTAKPDYLVVTLSNYSKVKICWEDMDTPTPSSRADLKERIDNLKKAIRTRVAPETVIWNATIPDRIFADTKGAF